jgi:hypothetical protein
MVNIPEYLVTQCHALFTFTLKGICAVIILKCPSAPETTNQAAQGV